MIKISKKDFEKFSKKKCIENLVSLGVDPASRTGWAIAELKDKFIELDYGFVNVDSKDIYFKYDNIIQFFFSLIESQMKSSKSKKKDLNIVIEDVFFGNNVNVLKMLSRIGMIVYVLSYLKNLKKTYILATSARSRLGFRGNVKKDVIHEEFKKRFNISLDDPDIIDAIILALNGLAREDEGLFE